jgi:dTDP-4-dehydrorhamnose 3,5-epimerase
VALDLRPESPTFCQWEAVELAAESRRMLYIPEGFAHGFITLEDSSEVFYQLSAAYAPGSARGVRWDDPAFAIEWPIKPGTMTDRDRSFECFPKRKPHL